MRCYRCHKRLKKAYRHNGRVYGPECVQKAGGIISKDRKVIIKPATEEDYQGDLFDEGEL